MLYPNIEELRQQYMAITTDKAFTDEFDQLLKGLRWQAITIVSGPSVFRSATGQTSSSNAKMLNHTGSHKINKPSGRSYWRNDLGKKRIIAETGAGQHGVATATVCALKA